jgi:Sigma-70 region 2
MVETTNLLLKIAQGDRSALLKLYDRYARTIYALAGKSLHSVEECEEVVLDVFAQIWQMADSFDVTKGSVEQWVFTLARSRILARLHKLQWLDRVERIISCDKGIDFPIISVDGVATGSRYCWRTRTVIVFCSCCLDGANADLVQSSRPRTEFNPRSAFRA